MNKNLVYICDALTSLMIQKQQNIIKNTANTAICACCCICCCMAQAINI